MERRRTAFRHFCFQVYDWWISNIQNRFNAKFLLDEIWTFREDRELAMSLYPLLLAEITIENNFNFLKLIIDNLTELENGIEMMYWDGKNRKIFSSVPFITAYWPAGTKVACYMVHQAKHPCCYCEKFTNISAYCILEAIALGGVLCAEMDLISDGLIESLEITRPLSLRGISWEIEARTSVKKISIFNEVDTHEKETLGIYLDIVFCRSLPYDSMHLLLDRKVKKVIQLVFVNHDKVKETIPYVIISTDKDVFNKALELCKTGYPSSWRSYPLPITKLARYKAEKCKTCILHYALHYPLSSHRLQVWVSLRNILHISLKLTPKSVDATQLKVRVKQFHALYAEGFPTAQNL